MPRTLSDDIGEIASLTKKERRKYRRLLIDKHKEGTETMQERIDLAVCNLMRLLSGNHFYE